MESDREPKPSLVAIGEKLKKARQEKGLALDQVQKHTHIYPTILVALEEGRCDEILPSTYVKSFLKKYSHYVGLDSNEILKQYISVHPEGKERGTLKLESTAKLEKADIFSRFLYIIGIALLLVACLSLLTFLGKKAAARFRPKLSPQAAARKVPPPKISTRLKAARMMPASQPSKEKKAADSAESAEMPIPKKVPLNLVLKTKQAVLVGVKIDGVILSKTKLPKGAAESFKADDKIELYVAKAEAIELILNGKPLSLPGKGVIKNLEITRSGLKIK